MDEKHTERDYTLYTRGDVLYTDLGDRQDVEVMVDGLVYIRDEPVYLVRETIAPCTSHGAFAIDLSPVPRHQ